MQSTCKIERIRYRCAYHSVFKCESTKVILINLVQRMQGARVHIAKQIWTPAEVRVARQKRPKSRNLSIFSRNFDPSGRPQQDR